MDRLWEYHDDVELLVIDYSTALPQCSDFQYWIIVIYNGIVFGFFSKNSVTVQFLHDDNHILFCKDLHNQLQPT